MTVSGDFVQYSCNMQTKCGQLSKY